MMNAASILTLAALAAMSAGCADNELLHAPKPPEQKTSFSSDKHEKEKARTYDIRKLNEEVAERQQKAYEAERNKSHDLVCVPEEKWDVRNADESDVTFFVKGPMLDPSEAKAVHETMNFLAAAFQDLEVNYAHFQDFRRRFDGAQHDARLLNVAIQQGLATMYAARRLLDFASAFEAGHCSLKPFKKGLKGASAIASDVGQGQLPTLMHVVDQRDPWMGRLLKIQLGVVTSGDALGPCGDAVRELKDGVTNYDTSILAWCGYAAAKVGQTEVARAYWQKAGNSVHDPEGASYSLARLRDSSDGVVDKVKIQRLRAD